MATEKTSKTKKKSTTKAARSASKNKPTDSKSLFIKVGFAATVILIIGGFLALGGFTKLSSTGLVTGIDTNTEKVVQNNDVVNVSYKGYFDNGEVFDEGEFEAQVGTNQ